MKRGIDLRVTGRLTRKEEKHDIRLCGQMEEQWIEWIYSAINIEILCTKAINKGLVQIIV